MICYWVLYLPNYVYATFTGAILMHEYSHCNQFHYTEHNSSFRFTRYQMTRKFLKNVSECSKVFEMNVSICSKIRAVRRIII
jgi:hypothetical protein